MSTLSWNELTYELKTQVTDNFLLLYKLYHETSSERDSHEVTQIYGVKFKCLNGEMSFFLVLFFKIRIVGG